MSNVSYWPRFAALFFAPLAFATVVAWAVTSKLPPADVIAERDSIVEQAKRPPLLEDFDKLSTALRTPIMVEFDETPLIEVLDNFSRRSGIPIEFDANLSPELKRLEKEPITINLSQPISLKSALYILLDSLLLKMRIEVDRIVVLPENWPPDRSRELFKLKPYWCEFSSNYTTEARQSLIEEIQKTIEPASWESAGGRGRIAAGKSVFHIEVYQSNDVHGEIEELFRSLAKNEKDFERDNDSPLTVDELRKKYSYVSLRNRIPSEKPTDSQFPIDTVGLDEVEDEFGMGQRRFALYRGLSLEQLHKDQVSQFVEREGEGFRRSAPPPGRFYLALPKSPLVPFVRQPNEPSHGTVWTNHPDRQAWGLPSEKAFKFFHRDGINSFVAEWSLGHFKDLDHVAGFASHTFRSMPKMAELREDFDNEKLQTDQWLVSRLELVSLLKFEEPAVYVSEFLPRMDKLAEAKTRPLGEFESRALAALREGEDLVSEYSLNHIRMVGSLRAIKQCLACHQVERGELLGAFSYDLWRDPPRKETSTEP